MQKWICIAIINRESIYHGQTLAKLKNNIKKYFKQYNTCEI